VNSQNSLQRKYTRGRILISIWLWFCLWGGLSASLLGQDYRTFRQELGSIKQRTRWRFGPLRIAPALQFDLSYDSNIYRASQEQNMIADYVATLSVPFSIYLLHREWFIFSLLENPQYVYFFETAKERAFNNSYTPVMKLFLLQRFALSGSYQYIRSKERWLLEVDARVVQEVKGWSGSLFYETIRNTAIGFSWSDLKLDYEDILAPESDIPLSRGLNRREKNSRVEFYCQVFSDSSFFLNAGLTDYKFDDPQVSFKDSTASQLNLGIRFPLLGRIRGTLSLGYKKYLPSQEGQSDFSGIVGNTNLEVRLGRLNFRVLYLRDIPFSYDLKSTFYIADNFGAGLSFYPSQSLRLDYNFTYGENVYPESPIVLPADEPSQATRRKELYRTHSGNVVIRVIRSMGIGLTVNYFERISNYFGEMKRLMAGAFITYDF
jgi:hypothetical protein